MHLARLKPVRRRGKVYWYYRRKDGSHTPLVHGVEADDPDLLSAYAKAAREGGDAPQQANARTVAGMARLYELGPLFAALKPSTQEVRRRQIKRIVAKSGDVAIRAIQRKHIQADIDSVSPGSASHRLDTWRQMFRAVRRAGWREDDPTAKVELPRYEKTSREAWTIEDVAAFEEHWPVGTPQRIAFALLYWTGARASDVVKMGWPHVKDGWLTWRQEKTRGVVEVPIAGPLALALEHAARDRLTFLETRQGRARSVKAFSQWFAAAAREAGVDKSAHGLRHTLASAGASAGLTAEEIAAVTGHANIAEVSTYTKAANRRVMAARVIAALEAARTETAQVMETPLENSAGKR